MKDFYYILGMDANCTSADIREAYRKLSKKFHPDLNQNDQYFAGRFREVNEAYETLIDPAKRSKYDSALKSFKGQTTPPFTEPTKKGGYLAGYGINIAFTLALMALTVIFGDYVYQSIKSSHPAVAPQAAIVTPVAGTGTHQKRKHKLQPPFLSPAVANHKPRVLTSKAPVAPAVTDNTNIRTVPTQVAIAHQPKPTVITDSQPAVVNHVGFLYATNIKANVTGLVYLRKTGDYQSDKVAAIPGNAKVLVLEKGITFCKVSFNNKTGYVPNWTVQPN